MHTFWVLIPHSTVVSSVFIAIETKKSSKIEREKILTSLQATFSMFPQSVVSQRTLTRNLVTTMSMQLKAGDTTDASN